MPLELGDHTKGTLGGSVDDKGDGVFQDVPTTLPWPYFMVPNQACHLSGTPPREADYVSDIPSPQPKLILFSSPSPQ